MSNVWWHIKASVRRPIIIAYLILAVGTAVAIGFAYQATKENSDAIQQSKDERTARVKVSAEINRYVCSENNKQDRILASLIEASLGGGGSFANGLDTSELSSFDKEVLISISKIQALSEGDQPAGFEAVFKRALAQLRTETPCSELVSAFKAASDTQDYKAIRDLLRSFDRKDREAADKVAPAP